MIVSALILAAGASSRFTGEHKLFAEVGGVPLIRNVVIEIAASAVDEIIVVTADTHEQPLTEAIGPGRWRVVVNTQPSDGLSSSLRTGLEAARGDAEGLLVALGDMPGVSARAVDTLLDAFRRGGGRAIVFPVASDGHKGHPVIWPKSFALPLAALSGDVGGRAVLEANRELWLPVSTAETGAFVDIDTRADLDAFLAHRG